MATTRRETPEQEAARMAAIADKKAKLDAMVADLQAKLSAAEHSGTQLNLALLQAAERAIESMQRELDELEFRTKIVPPKDPGTHVCKNTGLKQPCAEAKPRCFNSRCDLCGKINNRM